MPTIDESYNYIEKAFSVSKLDYFDPWKIEYIHPLDSNKKEIAYLENKYHLAGTTYQDCPVLKIGEDFAYILDQLFPRITRYPYQWPLEGQKIDPNGYDFYSEHTTTGTTTFIEIVQSAKVIAWEKMNILSPIPELEFPVTQEEYVEGALLTKLSLTLGKAGPISTIAFNLHTTKPMELLSLVYEGDTTSYNVPKKINLEYLGVKQDSYTISIRLAKPIFAKRLTMVFGQNNADQNIYRIQKVRSEAALYGATSNHPDTEYTSIQSMWTENEQANDLLLSKEEFTKRIMDGLNFETDHYVSGNKPKKIDDIISEHNQLIKQGGN
ncbi:hypothetical protein I4L69_001644 [Enterococcus faecium]|nr:hypothetical protein [Enterococcus faecium]